MTTYLKVALLAGCTVLAGCMTAQQHREAVQPATSDSLTAGKVQREIRVGMTSAEVVEALGSPNLVTTDEQRREVWVYDKISTERVYSNSSSGGGLVLLGWAGNVAGGGGLSGSANAGASSTSQKTITVIVKYDNSGRVRDYAYRQSQF